MATHKPKVFVADDETPVFNGVLGELGDAVMKTGADLAAELARTGTPIEKMGHHAKRRLRKMTTEALTEAGFTDE